MGMRASPQIAQIRAAQIRMKIKSVSDVSGGSA
jgi:hypothetical protein